MCEMPSACRYPTSRRAFSKLKPALNCRRYVESGLALRFSEASRSRHSEIPLDSGVNTAGLALMGLLSTREFLRQKLPITWMHVSRDANQGRGRFANLAGRVENSLLKTLRSYIKHASNR